MTTTNAQAKINEIQAIYKQWLELSQKLEQAHQDLVKSTQLMQQLETFYFEGEYSELYEQIENGLDVDLTTSGEYSVMSEDTLWNAFHEHQSLLWQNLRFAVKHLDKADDE
ncbi:DUF4298 domain-containing protein [Moraxella sp. ZY210820]|uniref:DUF4298 domain-containing protein n=1 Tax=unclassified Moraxella TaxID=2685852 RepID=UPI00272F86F6|nr:DUF4298 domain-containing protein [Moraxella sp. ZY210820]WLF84075.1 DUF4298 domain-containing protein [Moraxella sp. ZY210820]